MTFLDLNKMFRCPAELHSELLLCSIDQRSNIIRFLNQLLTAYDPKSTAVNFRSFEISTANALWTFKPRDPSKSYEVKIPKFLGFWTQCMELESDRLYDIDNILQPIFQHWYGQFQCFAQQLVSLITGVGYRHGGSFQSQQNSYVAICSTDSVLFQPWHWFNFVADRIIGK